MSATMDATTYEPLTDAESAPQDFEILSVRELTPHDFASTPPLTAKLFMSPEFTNSGGADVESGKTRDYVVVLEYPPRLENTVVRMNDCPTVHGSRMFSKFVESTAAEKGYEVSTADITDYL